MALDETESPEDTKQRHERTKIVATMVAGGLLVTIGYIFVALGQLGARMLALGRKSITKAQEERAAMLKSNRDSL